jgi:molybdopterin-guanine dinucleotide biosynthesis protein A
MMRASDVVTILDHLQNPMAVTGVVLSGGASHRMGQDKAALPLGGEPLLARVVRRLGAATGAVMVVGPPEHQALVPGVPIVPDARPGMGPLGGIFTALQVAPTPCIFVVACDMPFIQPELVRHLVNLAAGYAVVVPRSARGTEQLHAVYGRACLPEIAALLDAGDLAVTALYQRVRTRVVAPEDWTAYDSRGLSTFNANTPAEWERARALAAEDA